MAGRVLIVDDSPTTTKFFKTVLEKERHEVYSSLDGLNIVETIIEKKIDIVLLDIVMPEVSGFDILRMLQSVEHTKDTPVIMITSLTSAEHVKMALDSGALDYIRKPFEPIELIARVNSALKLKTKQEQLQELSQKDALTKLYNRRYFDTALERLFQCKDRYGYGLSLVMLDCDHFKKVNDVYGHTTGDEVLIYVASSMMNAIRFTDIACRYGGEEFCLILPNTSEAHSLAVAERVRTDIASKDLVINNQTIKISVSCGIAHTTMGDGKSELDLVNESDAALYEAKKNGRNRSQVFSGINSKR